MVRYHRGGGGAILWCGNHRMRLPLVRDHLGQQYVG